MPAFFLDLLGKLIENPRPGALTSGVTAFGGYGLTKLGTVCGVSVFEMDFLQILGVISMGVGIVVGIITLWAAVVRMKADRAKRRYFENETKKSLRPTK